MSKSLVYVVALFVILASLLAGCGGGSGSGYHCPAGMGWKPQSVGVNNPHGLCIDKAGNVAGPVADYVAPAPVADPSLVAPDSSIGQAIQILK